MFSRTLVVSLASFRKKMLTSPSYSLVRKQPLIRSTSTKILLGQTSVKSIRCFPLDDTIKATSVQKEAFKSGIQLKYTEAMVNHLRDRFSHVELLGVFSILDPLHKVFSTTYGEGPDPVVDTEQCASEWEGFKRLIKTSMHPRQCDTCSSSFVLTIHCMICFHNCQS